jgi:hypothetical protein
VKEFRSALRDAGALGRAHDPSASTAVASDSIQLRMSAGTVGTPEYATDKAASQVDSAARVADSCLGLTRARDGKAAATSVVKIWIECIVYERYKCYQATSKIC